MAVAEELSGPDPELVIGLNWNKPLLVVLLVEGACDAAGVLSPKDVEAEAGAFEVVVV